MPPPQVTGVAPREGYPGTKITLRGENLGQSYDDIVSVKICHVDVTLTVEWINSTKLIAYSGLCKGRGDVIVNTRSGGTGIGTVGFTGLIKKNIGSTDETAVWIDEDPKSVLTGLKKSVSNTNLIDNPLGICVEDTDNGISDTLEQLFPQTTGDIRKPNFNSTRFLLENYQHAKFDDLKMGLSYLRSYSVNKTTISSDTLLKSNIASFMDAIKILKNVYSLSAEDKRTKFMRNLETVLTDVNKSAHKIYDQDLAAKDKADMMRHALTIFESYKQIFALPQNIEKNLKKEDFDPIINEYKASKGLIAKQVKKNSLLFAQISSDVEKKIENVKKTLLDKLSQFPSSPDEQKVCIDYLYSLDERTDFDAGWYCIVKEKQWIIQLIIECRDMHIADEKVSLVMKENEESENKGTVNANANQNQKEKEKADDMNLKEPHERNKFIEELCEIFYDIFSDFWKLGQMYLQKTLIPKIYQQEHHASHLKFKLHSSQDFYSQVKEVLTTFANIIRTAFIPTTITELKNSTPDENLKKVFTSWPVQHDNIILSRILPHCLRVCRMCASQIHALDLPINLFDTLQVLIYDLRCECLKALLLAPTYSILNNLGSEEQDWGLERDQDIGVFTNMPIRFETTFLKALKLSKEYVLDDKNGERPIFRDGAFVNNIAQLIYGMIHSYFKRTRLFVSKEKKVPSSLNITRNKMLLYLYNNLRLCMSKILPNIWKQLTQHNYKQLRSIIDATENRAKELQNMLLDQYQLETIKPIITNIENNLYIGKFDFIDSPPPTTVRSYVKIIITNLISVHSELFSINPFLIPSVLNYAVKEIFTEIYRLLSNVPHFGEMAAIQTQVDVFCLKETLKVYTTDESVQLIQNILNNLIPKDAFSKPTHKELMFKIITDFERRMSPYILVLQQCTAIKTSK